ncbi:MAG TPA: DUF2158 domain-containing protein [Chitinophagaceae bacterium]|nr:DUF2158 domain-containing protein [Chitinophagaceae bacterium]
MDTEKLQITSGMVVWLKSGGPAMTAKIETNYCWVCTWFVENEAKEHAFRAGQLTNQEPNRQIDLPISAGK